MKEPKIVVFNRPHLIGKSIEGWMRRRRMQKYFGIGHLLPFVPANEREITRAIKNLRESGRIDYLENPELFCLTQRNSAS